MHGRQTWDGDGVEPRPDVCRQRLVQSHGAICVPEVPERFGVLHLLPMKALQRLDDGKIAPVHGLDMPDGDGTHEAAKAIPEQTDGNSTEDDGRGVERDVVEQRSCGKYHAACSGVGRGGGGDGAHRVLLQAPWAMVEEGKDPDAERCSALTAACSPPRFPDVATRQEIRPGFSEEVSQQDDEGTGERDVGGFELGKMSATRPSVFLEMNGTDGVNLLQDGHETGKDSGEEEASKGDGGVSIVA